LRHGLSRYCSLPNSVVVDACAVPGAAVSASRYPVEVNGGSATIGGATGPWKRYRVATILLPCAANGDSGRARIVRILRLVEDLFKAAVEAIGRDLCPPPPPDSGRSEVTNM